MTPLLKPLSLFTMLLALNSHCSGTIGNNFPDYDEPFTSLTSRSSQTTSPVPSFFSPWQSPSPFLTDDNSPEEDSESNTLKEIIAKIPLTGPHTEDEINALTRLVWDNQQNSCPLKCEVDFSSNSDDAFLKKTGLQGAFLAHLSKKSTIDLSNNNIGNSSSIKIACFFNAFLDTKNNNKFYNFFRKKHQLLSELQQSNCHNIENIEAAVQQCYDETSSSSKEKTLLTINLSENNLGSLYKKYTDGSYINGNPTKIWEHVAKMPDLYELDLTNNNLNFLDTDEYEEMLQLLLKSKSLRKLHISVRNLTTEKRALFDRLEAYIEEINRYRKPEHLLSIIQETISENA